MLPPDVEGKIMLSFVEERRRAYTVARENASSKRPSLRARLLRTSGDALIAAGSWMQALAGAPLPASQPEARIGEAAG